MWMAPDIILWRLLSSVLKYPEMLISRNREIKKKNNTSQDCRMHFLSTTSLKIAV